MAKKVDKKEKKAFVPFWMKGKEDKMKKSSSVKSKKKRMK